MFEDDDLSGAYSKVNPKAKKKKVTAKKNPIVEKKHILATPKRTKQVTPQQDKKPKQIQDQAGAYTSTDTIVVDKTGDSYWSIIKEDADRLTDHQILAYMLKRFGLISHQLEIIRPKINS